MTENEILAAISPFCVGIGDDAAVWQPSRSNRSVITTDMLVEGVDFTRGLMSLEDAGWRSMVANVSDLAAMGARPVLAIVALGLPESASLDEILELYRGLAAAARHDRVAIVGGDLSRAPVLTISIAAVGEVRPSNLKTRAGGRPGDVLCVTGALGAARASFDCAPSGRGVYPERSRGAQDDKFRRPTARVAEGRFLAASKNCHAMMDCSDGLSIDLERLCAASACGALLERVPVAPQARSRAREAGEDPERYALAAGEDFELVAAIDARAFAHLAKRFAQRFGRPLERVGTLCPQPGIEWQGRPLARAGWDHFDR